MSFCKFSNGFLTSGFTSVDNLFITNYMPFAKEEYTKVYLYGLFLCSNMAASSVENFSEEIGVDIDTVNEACEYWEEQGLMTIVSRSPLEVLYLPIKNSPVKKYKAEKYEDFNFRLQDLYPDREIPSGEYLKYYEFMDDTKISQDAMIMIVKYCINFKGLKVRYPYILTVARDWVNDNIKTVDDVENRIKEYELNSEIMREIAKAIGKKSSIEVEDKQLYTKWTRSWGYDNESILYAGSFQKNRGGFEKLDKTLDNFYKLGIFTIDAMKSYKDNHDKIYALAIDITKRLGLYYDSLEYIIETYISKWLNMGFSDETLLSIADICMKSNIKSYEGMNNKILFFYKNGCITKHAINEYLANLIEINNQIKKIIETLGSSRLPNHADRDYFETWTNRWGFSLDVILFVAKQCSLKSQSFAYLNNTLGRYYENKLFTIEDITKFGGAGGDSGNARQFNTDREFTKEELGNFFNSIDDLKNIEV